MRPPLLARALLRLRLLGERRRDVEADLDELFNQRAAARSVPHARRRYWADVFSLWRPRPKGRAVSSVARARRVFDSRGTVRDIVFAMRLFKRQPVSVGLTVAGLALAIGIVTAVFTLVNAAALRGFGITDPDSVVRVGDIEGTSEFRERPWTYGDFLRLKAASQTLDVVATPWMSPRSVSWSLEAPGQDVPPTARVSAVSGDYFSILGIDASIGRTLTVEDDRPGAPAVLVLGDQFWRSQFASDRSILGRSLWIEDTPFTVVGVAAGGVRGKDERTPAFYTPLAIEVEKWRQAQIARAKETGVVHPMMDYVGVIGRLRPGVTPQRASDEVRGLSLALDAEHGWSRPADRIDRVQRVNEWSRGSRNKVALLMTILSIVLVLGCANVTNLLLAQAAGRRHEIGARLALGATRGRIVRQMLTESLLLGLAGGVAGFIVATWLVPVFVAFWWMDPLNDLSPDWRVYVFATAISVAAGLVTGLAPARFSRRGDLVSAMKTDRSGAPMGGGAGRIRATLVGMQTASTVVLLLLAAICARGLFNAAGMDIGVKDADRLIYARIVFKQRLPAGRQDEIRNEGLERVRRLPSVESAAMSGAPPVGGSGYYDRFGTRNDVTAEYFDTLGMTMVRGRGFTPDEVRSGAPVVVISEGIARKFWPDADPIGDPMTRVWGKDDDKPSTSVSRRPAGARVVGVVTETLLSIDSQGEPSVYMPMPPGESWGYIVVRTRGDAAASVVVIRDALRAIDPDVRPVVEPFEDAFDRQLKGPRSLAVVAALLGVSALGLAIIGLVGVSTFAVRQRRQEVSVRVALGARPVAILRMLLTDGLRPVGIGLVIGLGLAYPATTSLVRYFGANQRGTLTLWGVAPMDPIAIAVAVGMLLVTAALAIAWPARAAARVDAAQVLKT